MLRMSLVMLSVLSLSGCLELGGGGSHNKPRPPSPAAAPAPTPTPAPAPAPAPTSNSNEPPPAVVPPPAPPAPAPTPAPPAPAPLRFAEPAAAVIDEIDALGFFDNDASGAPRAVRNDLSGNLPAMLQFVQSLSINPQGNEAQHQPRLTSEREALLLVTPDPGLSGISSLSVDVSLDGQFKGRLNLSHPDDLPANDRPADHDERPNVVYSRRAWSAVLPWDWVRPGMALSVQDNQGRSGSRAAADFDFAPPGQMVLTTLRLGMLTAPPTDGDQAFLTRPAEAAADYFQSTPLARLTSVQYEDVQLPRVMVRSGVIYDLASVDDGDYYSGDMRENVGKSTFSVGINLANWGITSASMAQQNPRLTFTGVVHHASGRYNNGVQRHGLSGGNGIITLIDGVGNEFSHELGHNYGLGHYPGMNAGNHFWSVHHHDSGWGYLAHRKRMRANLVWSPNRQSTLIGQAVYKYPGGHYFFLPDAMSGGWSNDLFSQYTLYTGYSTQTAIQPSLDRAMWYSDSPTGYRLWNPQTRRMEVHRPRIGNSPEVWFNRPDGYYPAPRRAGVPVFTLLGGYHPGLNSAVLYPAARGNWGNVFDLPGPDDQASGKQCWLSIDYADGHTQRVAVAAQSLGQGADNGANKLHVNLAQDEQPRAARLICRDSAGAAEQQLASVNIAQNLPAMPAPVIIGQEHGLQALRAVELPRLQSLLEQAAGEPMPYFSQTEDALLRSYADQPDGLSATALQVLSRLQQQQQASRRLNRWLDAYASQLDSSAEARTALNNLLATLGLNRTPLLPEASLFTTANGDCVKREQLDGNWRVFAARKDTCSGAIEEQWRVDASGRIRSASDLGQCLTASSELSLSPCDSEQSIQRWQFSGLPELRQADRCIDLAGGNFTDGRGRLIMYRCQQSSNQMWYGLQLGDNQLWPLLKARHSAVMQRFVSQQQP